jgi:transposase-like protein
MGRGHVIYSEAFRRQVVEEIERGKFASIYEANRAYGIKGNATINRWVQKYGQGELLQKRVRIETLKERDELKEARKRIRELEAALADAHIDCCLEESYLKIACEYLGYNPLDFKKKNAITLSDMRKKPKAEK